MFRRHAPVTVDEAMQMALWAHWCGEDREADKLLRLVIKHILKEPPRGQKREQSASRG